MEKDFFTPEQQRVLVENSMLISQSGLAHEWAEFSMGSIMSTVEFERERASNPEEFKPVLDLGKVALNALEAPFIVLGKKVEAAHSSALDLNIGKVNPQNGEMLAMSEGPILDCGIIGKHERWQSSKFNELTDNELAQVVKQALERFVVPGYFDPILEINAFLLRLFEKQENAEISGKLVEPSLDTKLRNIIESCYKQTWGKYYRIF